jgi:hypothetical protein
MVRGQRGGVVRVPQPDRREDRAVLGQRVVHAAAQRQRAVLEPADLAVEPVVYLPQLGVSAQLAQQLVERDVGGGELARLIASSLDSATWDSSVPGRR